MLLFVATKLCPECEIPAWVALLPSSVQWSMVALAPGSMLITPVPLKALPVPFELKLEMIQEFRIVTFLAAMTSAPVIFSRQQLYRPR